MDGTARMFLLNGVTMKKIPAYTMATLLALAFLVTPLWAEIPADIIMEDSEHPLVKITTDKGSIFLVFRFNFFNFC